MYKTTLLGSFAMSKLLGIFGAEGFHYSDRLKAIGVQGEFFAYLMSLSLAHVASRSRGVET